MHVNCPMMGNIASFYMNNFWGPLKLNLPRAPNVLRPALDMSSDVMTERNDQIMIQLCVATAEHLRYNVSRCNVYTLFVSVMLNE